jgi:hypothetical protein
MAPTSPLLAVGIAAAMLVGCLKGPLDPQPLLERDPAVLGLWLCVPDDPNPEAGTATIHVSPQGDRGYAITFQEPDEEPEHYTGYLSETSVGRLMNVHSLKPPSTGSDWALFRYSLPRPGLLSVEILSENAYRNTDGEPGAVRAALQEAKDRPGLFEGYCACTRVQKGKEPSS